MSWPIRIIGIAFSLMMSSISLSNMAWQNGASLTSVGDQLIPAYAGVLAKVFGASNGNAPNWVPMYIWFGTFFVNVWNGLSVFDSELRADVGLKWKLAFNAIAFASWPFMLIDWIIELFRGKGMMYSNPDPNVVRARAGGGLVVFFLFLVSIYLVTANVWLQE